MIPPASTGRIPPTREPARALFDIGFCSAEWISSMQIPYNDIKVRLAEVDHHTWAPPLAVPAEPPKPEDKTAMAEKLGVETIDFSDFTKTGFWDVDDVLRPIYEEASKAVGREFPYPGDAEKGK